MRSPHTTTKEQPLLTATRESPCMHQRRPSKPQIKITKYTCVCVYIYTHICTKKEDERIFWTKNDVLYLDRVGFIDILICQNLSNGTQYLCISWYVKFSQKYFFKQQNLVNDMYTAIFKVACVDICTYFKICQKHIEYWMEIKVDKWIDMHTKTSLAKC